MSLSHISVLLLQPLSIKKSSTGTAQRLISILFKLHITTHIWFRKYPINQTHQKKKIHRSKYIIPRRICTKYIYTKVPQCLFPRWSWDPPPPLPQASVYPPPPRNQRGGHSPAGDGRGGGGPNSDDWRKSLALCLPCVPVTLSVHHTWTPCCLYRSGCCSTSQTLDKNNMGCFVIRCPSAWICNTREETWGKMYRNFVYIFQARDHCKF